MKTFIYELIDPRTDEPKYIGKSNNPQNRYKEHLKDKKQTYKANWIKGLKEHGLKPRLNIIEEVEFNKWEFWEQFYIDLYRSWGFKLTNLEKGGLGIGRQSSLTKKKISISRKNKGNKKIQQISFKNFKIIKTWNSVSEAANYYKIYPSYITASCILSQLTTCGFYWKYEKESFNEWYNKLIKEIEKRKTKSNIKAINRNYIRGYKIIQFDLQTKYEIKIWNSIKDAAEFYQQHPMSIWACLKGKQKSSCGYGWKYQLTGADTPDNSSNSGQKK